MFFVIIFIRSLKVYKNLFDIRALTGKVCLFVTIDLLDLCLLIPWGTKGRNKTPPTDSVLAGPLQLGPCLSGSPSLSLSASFPSLPRTTNFSFSLRVPVKGLPGDVGYRLP